MDNPGSRPAKEIFGVELGEYDGPRFADKSFLAAMSARRIFQELEQLKKEPVPCCLASPAGDDITRWIIVITGPKDSVYADGTFFVEMEFPRMYPYSCPRVSFLTRIYHHAVSTSGEVSLACLKNWCSTMGIRTVLTELMSIFYLSSTTEILIPLIAKQFNQNRKEFEATARNWTKLFAK